MIGQPSPKLGHFLEFFLDFQPLLWFLGMIWSIICGYGFHNFVSNFFIINLLTFMILFGLNFPYLWPRLRLFLLALNLIVIIPPVFFIRSVEPAILLIYGIGFIFFTFADLFVFIGTFILSKN